MHVTCMTALTIDGILRDHYSIQLRMTIVCNCVTVVYGVHVHNIIISIEYYH